MASSVASLLCALSFATCAASLKTSASHENALPSGTKPDYITSPPGKFPWSWEGQECPRHCTPDECGHADWSDMEKPFTQVFREQPLIDGFCYYTQLAGGWLADVPMLKHTHNVLQAVQYNDWYGHRDMGNHAPVYLHYDDHGRTVTLRARLHPFYQGSNGDIAYYHALGWLQGQGLDATKMTNYTAWKEVATAECQRLKDLENFDDDTFTWKYHHDSMHMGMNESAYHYRAHAYGKCILGVEGAMGEMIWGYLAIGCVLPNNYIGHGTECDDYYGPVQYKHSRPWSWYR